MLKWLLKYFGKSKPTPFVPYQKEKLLLKKAVSTLKIEKVNLAKIERFRWFLEDRAGLGPEMIRLERLLQELTHHPIDLRVEPKKDQNKRFDRNYLRKVEKL